MFSDEIRNIRCEMGLSQINFGKKYKIPRRTIQGWEGGANIPEWEQDFILFRLKSDLASEKEDSI